MRINNLSLAGKSAIALGLLMIFAVSSVAWGEVYVYEMPDGTRMITDHPINAKHTRVVRVAPTVKDAGRLASQKNSPVFREAPDTYDRVIRRYADEYGVEFALVKAIMQAESSFNPYAVSDKGARGLMQVMPSTASQYGVKNIYNPQENIRVAVQHLKYLFDTFDQRPVLVIAAYNAGETAVKKHRGIPPYEETENYVKKVLQFKRQYTPNYRVYSVASNPSGG